MAGSRSSRTARRARGVRALPHGARRAATSGSRQTAAKKFGSTVTMTSGFHASTCSMDTGVSPPRPSSPGDVARADAIERLGVDRAGHRRVEAARRRVRSTRAAAAPPGSRATRASISASVTVAKRAHSAASARRPRISPSSAKAASGMRSNAPSISRYGIPVWDLHAIGERDVGRIHRAVVEDEIGLRGDHGLDVRAAAAPGQAAERRQVGVALRDERALGRPERASSTRSSHRAPARRAGSRRAVPPRTRGVARRAPLQRPARR